MASRLSAASFARWAMLWLLGWAWVLGLTALLGEPLRVTVRDEVVDLSFALRGPAFSVLSIAYGLACMGFLLRVREVGASAALIVMLALLGLAEKHVRDDSMPPLATLLGTTMLASWAGGLVWARDAERATRERLAHELMCGTLAASFFLAGVAKLELAGLGWAEGGTHAMFIYERAASDFPFITDLRLFLARHPNLCAAAAGYALLVECSAPIYLWRSARRTYGWMVVAMFGGMGLALGLVEHGWEILPLALAYSSLSDRGSEEAVHALA